MRPVVSMPGHDSTRVRGAEGALDQRQLEPESEAIGDVGLRCGAVVGEAAGLAADRPVSTSNAGHIRPVRVVEVAPVAYVADHAPDSVRGAILGEEIDAHDARSAISEGEEV